MYGIMTQDGHLVVCDATYQDACVLSRWNYTNTPMIIRNQLDADLRLQKCIAYFDRYDLVIFNITKEMEEDLIMRKLRGR